MNADIFALLIWGIIIIVPTGIMAWWGVKEEE